MLLSRSRVWYSPISDWRVEIWPRKESINIEFASLFIIGLFLMFRARDAYFTVPCVSSKFDSAGDTHAIMVVLEFPPRESCNMRVNFEFR